MKSVFSLINKSENFERILVLANNSGGLYGFRGELLVELDRKHEVSVSVPNNGWFDELEGLGCEIFETQIDRRGINPSTDLKLLWFYIKLLKKVRPDVVLTYTIKPNIYGGLACRIAKIPYITTITGLGTAFEKKALRMIATLLYRIGLGKANAVMFQNSANQKLFEDLRIGRNYRSVFGSGVNLEKHCFEDYPIQSDQLKLLFIGRLMREKGIYELVEAVRSVRSKGKNVVLHIVGTYDDNCGIMLDQAESESLICRHGYQKDVHTFIKDCHAVILPSYHEGMANVLLEAAATGRPVLASDIPGCRETFDEGISGFGFPAKNAEAVADVIEHFAALTNEERAQMGLAGRKKMEREFDRNQVVAAYMEEIEKALK